MDRVLGSAEILDAACTFFRKFFNVENIQVIKDKDGSVFCAEIKIHNCITIELRPEAIPRICDLWKPIVEVYKTKIAQKKIKGVFLLFDNKDTFNLSTAKLFSIDPDFTKKVFIASHIGILQENKCLYNDKTIGIDDALQLVEWLGINERS